jgi:hypothetical protein
MNLIRELYFSIFKSQLFLGVVIGTHASPHTKKNKKNLLLTNTHKKFFKAKGLIFLFAP